MEEVFLWLQRTMLGMVDDEEEEFVDLGRKLLTVHKYVVVNATTEAEFSRTFWHEVTELTKHGVEVAEKMARQEEQEEQEEVPAAGVGGGEDPREDSVLLALPGFRFKVSSGVGCWELYAAYGYRVLVVLYSTLFFGGYVACIVDG